MSKTITKPASVTAKKIVKISENELVELIVGILTEAVAVKKKEWITEQAKKEADKSTLLENRIAALESKLNPKSEPKK